MSSEILLRPLVVEDVDQEYCSWYANDDGHLDYFSGTGRVFDREALLTDLQEGLNSGRWFYYIIQAAEGARIGNVKIGPIDKRNKTSDLVCMIGNRAFLGKGMAAKAIALANEIAFEKHDIRRLHGGMYSDNIASIKAYTKAGWVIEATFKGFYWVNDGPQDRICVACFNPKYFPANSK